jgi:hypothetical protein
MPVKVFQSKSQGCFEFNVAGFMKSAPIEQFLFCTFTFADDVKDSDESARRWKNFTSVMADRYGNRWIKVHERHRDDKIHYHVIVDTGADVRRGFDFAAYSEAKAAFNRGDKGNGYKHTRIYGAAASPAWRKEKEFLKLTAKRYGFGRVEAVPIRKSGGASARYLSEYMSKAHRSAIDKGVRLWAMGSGVLRTASSKFSWVGNHFRQKCQAFKVLFGQSPESKWGKHWAFSLMQYNMPPAWLYDLPPWAKTDGNFAGIDGSCHKIDWEILGGAGHKEKYYCSAFDTFYIRNDQLGRWDLVNPLDYLPIEDVQKLRRPDLADMSYPASWDEPVLDLDFAYDLGWI